MQLIIQDSLYSRVAFMHGSGCQVEEVEVEMIII